MVIDKKKHNDKPRLNQGSSADMSKLFRNVPIVNFLEMSPSWVVVFSLEYALKRSPVARAKRKCVFQRAALRSSGSEPGASCFDNPAATDGRA